MKNKKMQKIGVIVVATLVIFGLLVSFFPIWLFVGNNPHSNSVAPAQTADEQATQTEAEGTETVGSFARIESVPENTAAEN